MLLDYEDIRSLTDQPPLWFDHRGVPRWCEFTPGETGIYNDEAILLLIRCQSCHHEFQIGIGVSSLDRVMREVPSIAEQIRNGSVRFGDPPNIGCCPSGPTMSCEELKVLQYWTVRHFEWVRVPENEISLLNEDEVQDL